MLDYKKISPTFCVLPWMHLAAMPNGFAKVCCLSKEDMTDDSGKILSFETNEISEIWNSKPLIEARKKMLAGEKVSGCAQCYEEESLGEHSMRIGFNEKWCAQEPEALTARIEESINNSFKLTSKPWYYDLRQGNLCNLKCRSCSPENSTTIEKEYAQIIKKEPEFTKFLYQTELSTSYKSWFHSQVFTDSFQNELVNIKKLYFTGGEPTLIEKNYEILEFFVNNDLAKGVELMFNTNATKISDRFIQLLKKFKHVMLNLSIDGFSSEQEYLRGGSSWKTINSILNSLAENYSRNIHIVLNPVIQASNVLTIDKLFYYIESLNDLHNKKIFYFMPVILTQPAYLDFCILPDETRLQAAENLKRYKTISSLVNYDAFFSKRIDQIIAKLSYKHPESEALTRKFIYFNSVLDRNRKQNFQTVFPELYLSWSKNSEVFKYVKN